MCDVSALIETLRRSGGCLLRGDAKPRHLRTARGDVSFRGVLRSSYTLPVPRGKKTILLLLAACVLAACLWFGVARSGPPRFRVPAGLHATKTGLPHRVIHPIWIYRFTDDPDVVFSQLSRQLAKQGWRRDPQFPADMPTWIRDGLDTVTFERSRGSWKLLPDITCQATVSEEPTWIGDVWDQIKYRYRW
jgi:hypothetical protein